MRSRLLLLAVCFVLSLGPDAFAGGGAQSARARTSAKPAKSGKSESKSRTSPPRRGLGKVFTNLARKKGDRVFHAEGRAYEGKVRTPDGKEKEAVIRFSRGGAGKSGKRDILGVAVKVKEGRGRVQDYLLITSFGTQGLGARIPAFGSSFHGKSFSSITSFSQGNVRGTITSRLPGDLRTPLDLKNSGVSKLPQTFHLQLQNSWISRLLRRDRARLNLGQVTVDMSRPLTAQQSAELKMTPFNDAHGVKPVGWINGLRNAAYRGSQHGRADGGR